MCEVVIANAQHVAAAPVGHVLEEGVYLVGTGSTGTAETFLALGGIYATVMMAAALTFKVPKDGWMPAGWAPPETTESVSLSTHVHIDTALKTPQFWLLWTALGCNITAGIGIIGCATTMIKEIYGTNLPHIVDETFASNFIVGIAVVSIIGRIGWASFSDVLGRKNTYYLFFLGGMPLYLSVPFSSEMVATQTDLSAVPLVIFYGSTMLLFRCDTRGWVVLCSGGGLCCYMLFSRRSERRPLARSSMACVYSLAARVRHARNAE
jgi:hypothetical protein